MLARLCFLVVGVSAFSNPLDRFNLYNLAFGIVVGWLFGWLFKRFLIGFIGLSNRQLIKVQGKKEIKKAVQQAMIFLVPFTIIIIFVTYYLNWFLTFSVVSVALMTVSIAACMEISKILDRPALKNTVITAGVAFVFSLIWTVSYPFIIKGPPFLEGGINLIRTIISGEVGI